MGPQSNLTQEDTPLSPTSTESLIEMQEFIDSNLKLPSTQLIENVVHINLPCPFKEFPRHLKDIITDVLKEIFLMKEDVPYVEISLYVQTAIKQFLGLGQFSENVTANLKVPQIGRLSRDRSASLLHSNYCDLEVSGIHQNLLQPMSEIRLSQQFCFIFSETAFFLILVCKGATK
ncbi:hypothetical protein CEXT_271841 [Caerostris extrusa]|uniref:Uncharacterized protein n=1 Tax=Caerostris extrusa TaxID=172846 RepID=A0AAV4NS15_CAEEX|nr:hypothetical protein CEXT_271841 [Caerostris extrusa]